MLSILETDADLSPAEAAARDRRTHRRVAPSELKWIREVRLKYGPKVSLVDLSSGGALLQTDVRLRPGTDLVIEIVGPRVEAVPFRVLRSELARISEQGAVYQGACEFKRPLNLLRPSKDSGNGERCDVALKRLLLRRREEFSLPGGSQSAVPDTGLAQLLRSAQTAASADDPLSRGLRDLLSEVVPGVNRGEPAAVLRSKLEDRLRRAVPRAGITIGSAPLAPSAGVESIYFEARVAGGPGVLNVQFPEGSAIPDWEFRLLQAGSYLLELLPSESRSGEPSSALLKTAASADAPLKLADAADLPAAPEAGAGWRKIVVRYREGRLMKGFTHDFHPSRMQFSLWPSLGAAPSERVHVPTSQLKAVFFVRDFEGNAAYTDQRTFHGPVEGRRLEVTFVDDEVLLGSTLNYRSDGLGFFLSPADTRGNNLRVFVVSGAIRHMRFL
jgi:uncharacterized protein DUF6982